MITGLELLLAIFPLLISATEHHKKGLRPVKIIASTRTKNEQQLFFFNELYGELSLLGNTLKAVLGELPPRPETQETISLTQDEHEEVERTLGSSTAKSFAEILERLLKSLNDLVSDKAVGLNKSDVSSMHETMFLRLESFRNDISHGEARASLMERFKFTRNEKSRLVAMVKIREANRNLERLLMTSFLADAYDQQRPVPKKVERERLRRISSQPVPKTLVRFQIEGKEIGPIASAISPGLDIESEPLCKLIQRAHTDQSTLEIVFEQNKLWQTRSRRNSLSIQKQKDITLKEFLSASSSRMNLRDKWILGVVLAHAALHGSGSPWLSKNWSKEHISFFKKDDSPMPDLRRPFLRVQLDDTSQARNQVKKLWKVDTSLETLGVLLLEIHSGQPIESKWTKEDLGEDGQPNAFTNLTTACRMLKELEFDVIDGYKSAVRACLDAEMSSSENIEHFSKQVYERIVLPLERELENGFRLKPEHFELVPDRWIPIQA
ncbi:hypothetical protein H2200_003421 [Cladophialophora chaetospira]|uniref:DUF7580 domain-containing protein n=1 Tax=Cladophialophora chaetospira TaxID=386627 RepID=A0AA38XI72_9EURO|nr:hypothetical protein H2200_003421 [Cladophialophora chaetospira]